MAKEPCPGILVLVETELAIDDELDRDRAANALLGGRGERLVIGVGVQAVAVVKQRVQRLQRGADVVEVDLARVQAAARGLDVILQHLAARRRRDNESRMARAHIRRATRPITAYSGSMPLEKKNDRFGANSSISMPRAR